jgi:tetratricopeptide (TPR) repeat protein
MSVGSDAGAKLRAAVAHHRRGEIEAAIALYGEIVEAHPQHTQALQLLGQARLKRRDIDAAAACFQRILALEPENLRALESLGDTLHRRGDLDGASTAYAACRTGDDDRRIDDKIAALTFASEHLLACPGFAFRADLLAHALGAARPDDLLLELGVAAGASLRFLASLTARPVYGFDSFTGLPADWQPGFPAGSLAQAAPPTNLPANAHLVVGMFETTLPAFAAAHPQPVSFLHVDCDLYASTKTAFDILGDRLVSGSVIVFDEFLAYPGWRDHEYRAFQEFIARSGRSFDYIGWIPGGMQVAVKFR